ncbi:uncharacterized protein TTMY_0821 [Thermus thermophilus]|nr:uncharacterized protein TTMY_0821 [Thermus thermophilus]
MAEEGLPVQLLEEGLQVAGEGLEEPPGLPPEDAPSLGGKAHPEAQEKPLLPKVRPGPAQDLGAFHLHPHGPEWPEPARRAGPAAGL